ncbi:MAG: flavodoxin [Ruminococcaceae bacterium]|nr:flavodoxin [Oscillospiraceae bacterium]
MKRLLTLLLASALMFCACGRSAEIPQTTRPENTAANASAGTGENTAPNDNADESDAPRILVAYFAMAENSEVDAVSSASVLMDNGEAKGMSQYVAECIAEMTGGDLFSIRTETKYPGSYNPLADYAKREQDNDERPVLTAHIDSLDDYDVIFVGYPIWWYTLPMALFSFFDEYDFTGKTIIPFDTHFGSGRGGTPDVIAELEPGAAVEKNSFAVNQTKAADCWQDVADWLGELGY